MSDKLITLDDLSEFEIVEEEQEEEKRQPTPVSDEVITLEPADLTEFEVVETETPVEPASEREKSKERREKSKDYVTRDDLEAVAKRRGVDPDELRAWVMKSGGEMLETADRADRSDIQQALGWIGEEVFMGLPQKIERMGIFNKKPSDAMDKAIVDVYEIVDSKKSIGERIGGLAAGMVVPGFGAAKAATAPTKLGKIARLMTAGGIPGATYGFSHARRGEELEETAKGAAGGAIGGLVLYGAGNLAVRGISKASEKFQKATTVQISDEAREFIEKNKSAVVEESQRVVDRGRDGREELSRTLFDDDTLRAGGNTIEFYRTAPRELLEDMAENADSDFDLAGRTKKLLGELDAAEERGRFRGRDELRAGDVETLNELRQITGIDSDEALRAFIINRRFQFEVIDFANYLSGRSPRGRGKKLSGNYRDAVKTIQKARRSTNEDVMRQDYQRFREKKAVTARMNRNIVEQTETSTGAEWLFKALHDGRYITDAIDGKYNLEVTPLLDDLSRANNRVSQDMEIVTDMTIEGRKLYNRSGLTSDEILSHIEARTDLGEGADAEAVRFWGNSFQTVRTYVNDYAREKLGIRELVPELGGGKGYVPVHAVDDIEYIARLEDWADQIGMSKLLDMEDKELGEWLSRFYPKQRKAGQGLKDTAEYQWIRGLEIRSGVERANTPDRLRQAFTEAMDTTRASATTALDPSALRKRHDALPDFLREKDLSKILYKYSNQLFKYVHMDADLKRMRDLGNVLVEKGDKEAGQYLLNITKDVMGSRKGQTFVQARKAVLDWRLKQKRKAAAAETEMGKRWHTAMSDLPDTLSVLSANLYPYFLGLRADAVLRNLLQPWLMTAAEISSGASPLYAGRLALEANMDVIISATKKMLGKGRGPYAELSERGFIPGQFSGESVQLMRKGLLGSKSFSALAGQRGKEFLDRSADLSMAAYAWSDVQNRAVTLSMSKRIAADLLFGTGGERGKREALRFLQGADAGYRSRIARHMEAGDADGVEELISNYLLSKTQFNYNRVSMSEFGREFGTVMAMFSKWPSSIGADFFRSGKKILAAEGPERTHAMRNMTFKYMGPLIAAITLDKLFLEELREDEPLVRKIVGSRTWSWTPVASLGAFTSGQFATPPALSVPLDTAKELFRDDKEWQEKILRAMSTGVGMTPFGSIWKLGEESIEYMEALD